MDRGLSKEQVLEWLGSCRLLVYQMLCWDTRGISWIFNDIHGFDMVLSLIIYFQVLFLDILGVECW